MHENRDFHSLSCFMTGKTKQKHANSVSANIKAPMISNQRLQKDPLWDEHSGASFRASSFTLFGLTGVRFALFVVLSD